MLDVCVCVCVRVGDSYVTDFVVEIHTSVCVCVCVSLSVYLSVLDRVFYG